LGSEFQSTENKELSMEKRVSHATCAKQLIQTFPFTYCEQSYCDRARLTNMRLDHSNHLFCKAPLIFQDIPEVLTKFFLGYYIF
jgi:hypothetical protein